MMRAIFQCVSIRDGTTSRATPKAPTVFLSVGDSLIRTVAAQSRGTFQAKGREPTSLASMEDGQSNSSEDSGCSPLNMNKEHKSTGHSLPTGKIQVIGDIFQFTLDVSEFSPEEVIVISSNNLIQVNAEKLDEKGKITNTLSHQCKLPSDVDPISVSMSMEGGGVLTVRAHRM